MAKLLAGSRRPVLLLPLVAFIAAACGGDDTADTTAPAAAETTEAAPSDTADVAAPESSGADGGGAAVGMALPGPKNDRGFSQAHYEGILLAEEELGIVSSVQENVVDPQATIDALRNLAADNELVIGVGAEFAEAGVVVAPQFPDVVFMIINGQTSDAPNLYVYGVRQGVPAYIAGVLAPSLTQSGKVGFVGGLEIPPTTQSDVAWAAAIEATDPSVENASTITGDFNDAALAKEAAAAQLAAGADVIFGMLDAALPGAVQAIEESGTEALLFGVIFPRCEEFPQIVGTAVLNSANLVNSMISDHLNGTIPAEPLFYGTENPDIQRLELCETFATPENLEIVDTTNAGILDGSIPLPEGV